MKSITSIMNLRISESQKSPLKNRSLLCSIGIGSISLLTASVVSCQAASAATLYQTNYGTFNKGINRIDTTTGVVTAFNTSGVPLSFSSGLALDASGTLWSGGYSNTINRINTTTGVVTAFNTSGVPLNALSGLAFDASGTLWGAGFNSSIVKIDTTTGVVTEFNLAGNPSDPENWIVGLAFDASGTLFATKPYVSSNGIFKIDTTTGVATKAFNTIASSFGWGWLAGLAFDPSGNLWVSNYSSNTIVNIDMTTGVMTDFATSGVAIDQPFGLAFAPPASNSTAVPEPFTIIGTLIGGTAAIRMRNKLK
jgi:DNA-binding beta-propeller fold protein YncE